MPEASELERVIAALSDDDHRELSRLVKDELDAPFLPNVGPQTEALLSLADILLYGGQAGGGKSALLIGAAAREHSSALICRREAVQLDGLWGFATSVCGSAGWASNKVEHTYTAPTGRILKLAGLNAADDWRKHAGNARDFYGFDEAGEFLEVQVASLIGWLRTTRAGQRTRVILGSNPPRGGDGIWLLKWFAPWLDPLFANPAKPGELRWAIRRSAGEEIEFEWVDGPGEYERDGETYTAQSYTFIPASTTDNPHLDPGYRGRLQNLPEPLRSQLLYGDFLAGRKDDDWQVIPSAWVRKAVERGQNLPAKRRTMLALATDVAMGGADNLVTGALELMEGGFNIPPLDVTRGVDVTSPIQIAQNMFRVRRDNADMSVDLTGGWGTGVKSHLENDHSIPCHGIVFSEKAGGRTADGKLGFRNLRAEMFWTIRELLDPEGGGSEKIALPNDPRLVAELTAPRWKIVDGDKILVESKDDIAKRIGGSTDRADVVAMLLSRRHAVAVRSANRGRQGQNARGEWTEAAPDEGVLEW